MNHVGSILAVLGLLAAAQASDGKPPAPAGGQEAAGAGRFHHARCWNA